MPPVMGTAAFLMIDFVGVSYAKIIGFAIVPALLYYIALYIMVDLEARRSGTRANFSASVCKRHLINQTGWLFIYTSCADYIFSFCGYTASAGAFWATLSIAILVFIFDSTKEKTYAYCYFSLCCELAPNLLTSVAIACVLGGIIAGIINMTGLGLRISGIVLDISGGIKIVALFLTNVVGIILGMGMPVPGVYIDPATLLAPGLVKLGFMLEAVHMFINYCAVMSNITPPVAVASFAAAAIAETSVWRASWEAIKLGVAVFIIPYMFTYGPSLLGFGPPVTIVTSAITAVIGIFALSISSIGWFRITLTVPERIVTFIAAMLMIHPGYITDAIGFALLLLSFLSVYIRMRGQKADRINA